MILQRRWIFLSLRRCKLNLLALLIDRKIDYCGCKTRTARLKENDTPVDLFQASKKGKKAILRLS